MRPGADPKTSHERRDMAKGREFHVSWTTHDEDGYHGHWVHIWGTSRSAVETVAERDLRAEGVDLVQHADGKYITAEVGNCRHVATDRAETDPCERGTVGCSTDHTNSAGDSECEVW